MYKEVLRSIENIGVFPVSAFVLFFIIFCLIILWVITYDKKTIQILSSLPLENKIQDDSDQKKYHESK